MVWVQLFLQTLTCPGGSLSLRRLGGQLRFKNTLQKFSANRRVQGSRVSTVLCKAVFQPGPAQHNTNSGSIEIEVKLPRENFSLPTVRIHPFFTQPHLTLQLSTRTSDATTKLTKLHLLFTNYPGSLSWVQNYPSHISASEPSRGD